MFVLFLRSNDQKVCSELLSESSFCRNRRRIFFRIGPENLHLDFFNRTSSLDHAKVSLSIGRKSLIQMGSGGSEVVTAMTTQSEGHKFDSTWDQDFFLFYLRCAVQLWCFQIKICFFLKMLFISHAFLYWTENFGMNSLHVNCHFWIAFNFTIFQWF